MDVAQEVKRVGYWLRAWLSKDTFVKVSLDSCSQYIDQSVSVWLLCQNCLGIEQVAYMNIGE